MTEYKITLTPMTVEEKAADGLIEGLCRAGFTAYRVGGAVRDRLLGYPAHDVDVATDAPPQAVRELFPNTYSVGESFGVIIVHTPEGVDVEVATFRKDSEYADGRHPKEVGFSDSATDARRRDFTINAFFYDPRRVVVLDYTGGMADLRGGVVRAVGEAEGRFREDHLRMLRAVRFAAALGFSLETETEAALRRQAAAIKRISSERVMQELTRMLTGCRPAYALRMLEEYGLLEAVLPEVAGLRGVEQPPQFHPEGDVWKHTLLMLEKMAMPDPVLAWSVLLHDIGKPLTHEYTDGRDRFPNHAPRGAEATGEILKRLKASSRWVEDTMAAVENHMNFMHVTQMRKSTLRRLLARPTFPLELELHRLDCAASHAKLDGYCYLLDKLAELADQPQLPPPLVNGHDLLAMGQKPGPKIGELLKWIEDLQLNGELEDREQALGRLRDFIEEEKASSGEGIDD